MLEFFASKTIHPLADAREAKRILAEIAAGEPLIAVEDAGAWLESLAADQSFKLAQRLDLIFRIDEAAAAQARRLGRDYPSASSTSRVLESRHWGIAHGYWKQLAASCLDCIARYRAADKKEQDANRAQLPLLYARSIHALAGRLKWEQFRYGPVDPEFWMTLGGIYLAGVNAKAAEKSLQLHAGGAETTIEAEYLKVLIFQAASMDKLRPLEIEIAERFIAYFLPYFSLTRQLQRESVYWVDAAKSLPPTRLAKLPEITSSLRFFNGTRAVAAVGKTIEQIRSEARVPPGVNLGGQYEVGTVIPVLQHLEKCWAPKPPMRNNVRHRINSPLKVVNGLVAVYRRLSSQGSGTEDAETWVIDDVSLGGLGALVTVSGRDWIRIGALVGMQPEGGENWLLGIVRRYVRTGANQGSVGIETVSKAPRAITADADGLQTEALLLDVPEAGANVRMVLPANALEETVALVFSLDDKNARLHPLQTIETGVDFVVANFLVQSFR